MKIGVGSGILVCIPQRSALLSRKFEPLKNELHQKDLLPPTKSILMDTKRSALLVATVGSFLTPFMSSSINIALPSLGKEFAMDAVLLSWVNTLRYHHLYSVITPLRSVTICLLFTVLPHPPRNGGVHDLRDCCSNSNIRILRSRER